MRIAVADDSSLFRSGLASLLATAGEEVYVQARTADELLDRVADDPPDAAILDIRMPPTFTDEGLSGAERLRAAHPHVAVLVLSTYALPDAAARLIGLGGGIGYLIKDRVSDLAALTGALHRLRAGEVVIDPDVVARLIGRPRSPDVLDRFSDRERDVLRLMVEGHSNAGIGRELFLSARTVETHIATVFGKLGLQPAPDSNRRVLAVLAWLRSDRSSLPDAH